MRQVAEAIELAGTFPEVNVLEAEYARLLGFPRDYVLDGRVRELAEWARAWYAKRGRPWFYVRQSESLEFDGELVRIDSVPFSSKRLKSTLQEADAHSVILVAVGAGIEIEEEARRCWLAEKPDEYFFLEMYGSAVVEHLTTATGARLCDWAAQNGMAVLPHYSPGYPEWDVAEQPRLLGLMKHTRGLGFPSEVEAFDSGMLRPKKTQLAVFGLTRHTSRLQALESLVPCERCSFGPCQYRRAPWRRAPRPAGEQLSTRAVLDPDAKYTVPRKTLKRWAAERLVLHSRIDGSVEAVFRYDGTTCTNMGRPLAFHYVMKLGPRDDGYPILEQSCAPLEDDTGHEYMCKYIEDPEHLMRAIESEKPLQGQRLDAVLSWQRSPSPAGCYCEAPSREHKWGLAFETLHYALAQNELTLELESQ